VTFYFVHSKNLIIELNLLNVLIVSAVCTPLKPFYPQPGTKAEQKNTWGSGNPTDPNFDRDPNVFMTNVFFVISIYSANYGSHDTGIRYQSGVGNTSQYGQHCNRPILSLGSDTRPCDMSTHRRSQSC